MSGDLMTIFVSFLNHMRNEDQLLFLFYNNNTKRFYCIELTLTNEAEQHWQEY